MNPPTAACGKYERKLSSHLCGRDDDLQRTGRGALAGTLVYHPWFVVDRRNRYMRDLGYGSAICSLPRATQYRAGDTQLLGKNLGTCSKRCLAYRDDDN